ncbi:MAG: septum site-determining protein MinC, partial [Gammaproteobacteria bacterium]
VVADGHIHVYAPLRGRALAGVMGDPQARIFCQCMEAELVAVAGHYQIYEEGVPSDLHRNPVQVYLEEERLNVVCLVASEH